MDHRDYFGIDINIGDTVVFNKDLTCKYLSEGKVEKMTSKMIRIRYGEGRWDTVTRYSGAVIIKTL